MHGAFYCRGCAWLHATHCRGRVRVAACHMPCIAARCQAVPWHGRCSVLTVPAPPACLYYYIILSCRFCFPCRLIRQQDSVIDGGGIAHAHYRMQLWPASGAAGGSSAARLIPGASPGPTNAAGPVPADAAGGAVATDELWVSPPANFQKGQWDEQHMEQVGCAALSSLALSSLAVQCAVQPPLNGRSSAAQRCSLPLTRACPAAMPTPPAGVAPPAEPYICGAPPQRQWQPQKQQLPTDCRLSGGRACPVADAAHAALPVPAC